MSLSGQKYLACTFHIVYEKKVVFSFPLIKGMQEVYGNSFEQHLRYFFEFTPLLFIENYPYYYDGFMGSSKDVLGEDSLIRDYLPASLSLRLKNIYRDFTLFLVNIYKYPCPTEMFFDLDNYSFFSSRNAALEKDNFWRQLNSVIVLFFEMYNRAIPSKNHSEIPFKEIVRAYEKLVQERSASLNVPLMDCLLKELSTLELSHIRGFSPLQDKSGLLICSHLNINRSYYPWHSTYLARSIFKEVLKLSYNQVCFPIEEKIHFFDIVGDNYIIRYAFPGHYISTFLLQDYLSVRLIKKDFLIDYLSLHSPSFCCLAYLDLYTKIRKFRFKKASNESK